ncbi:MAK10-like protein [Tanacetum coccineum]
MPHKMEASNHIDFKDINTDFIPPSVLESNDDRGKTYYSDSLTLIPEYREDESISKEIRHLMKLEREAKRHKGEVTIKTLMRARCMRLSLPAKSRTSNWLERLPAGSITTWEDLTTRFLAQFFPPGRTAKLRMDSFQGLTTKSPSSWHRPLAPTHLAPTQPTQVNKINTSCEICSGPHDTQYCMEDPEQAFVEYASSRTDEAGDARLSKFKADFKQQQSGMTNKIDTVLKAITDRIAVTLPSDTVKNPKLSTYLVFSACSYPTEDPQCSTQTHGSINAITIHTEQQSASYNNGEKENKKEEDNPENIHVSPSTLPNPSVTFITEKVLKFNSFFESTPD